MKEIKKDYFSEKIKSDGWILIKDAYPIELINNAIDELETKEIYHKIQKSAGIFEDTKNAYHHSIILCHETQKKFLDPFPFSTYLNFILMVVLSLVLWDLLLLNRPKMSIPKMYIEIPFLFTE